LFDAFAPGGSSLIGDKDYDTALFADDVVGEGGIGPYDATQLRKQLAGKLVSVSAGLSELEETLSGRASPEDLETLFQLIHLTFPAPRKDPTAFETWRARLTEMVKNRRLNPDAAFSEDYRSLLSMNHLRRQPITPDTIARV